MRDSGDCRENGRYDDNTPAQQDVHFPCAAVCSLKITRDRLTMNIGRKLAEGVGSWLRFEQICGRTELFSEQYLTASIGQILLGNGYRVTPEYKHPVLLSHTTGRGKRPAVDFVCRDISGTGNITVAVESKWIGASVPSFRSIFWDIIRLSLIADGGADAYFVLGGLKRDISEIFKAQPFTAIATNKSKKFLLRLNEDASKHTVDQRVVNSVPLGPVVPDWEETIRTLVEPYPDMLVSNVITTQLSASFPKESKADQFQIVVWKVAVKSKSGRFRPKML